MCSSLILSQIQLNPYYTEAVDTCSSLNSSFDSSCKNCTDAISIVVENLLQVLGKKQDNGERIICSLAVVISVAATRATDGSFGANLLSCMSFLDDFGKD